MADDTQPIRTSRGFGFSAVMVFLVLLLYLLSPGPVAKYLYPKSTNKTAIERFYLPLSWAGDHVPGVKGFYQWYIEAWDE